MTFVRKNWLWLVINFVAILSLVGLVGMIDVGFNADGLPELTVQEFSAPPEAQDVPQLEDDHRERSPLTGLTHVTGEWAMRFLLLSLTCTPIFILFRWRQILSIKKVTGLWAFAYTVLHLIVFVADKGWWATFSEANFIMGLISLLIMLPLALTSHEWWMQALRKNWKVLHRAAYGAGIFAILHLAFLGEGAAIMYTIILGLGFALRLPPVRRTIAHWYGGSQNSRVIVSS